MEMLNIHNRILENFTMLTADGAVGWFSSEKLGGCDQINVLRCLPVFQFDGLSCFFASQDFTKLLEHSKH